MGPEVAVRVQNQASLDEQCGILALLWQGIFPKTRHLLPGFLGRQGAHGHGGGSLVHGCTPKLAEISRLQHSRCSTVPMCGWVMQGGGGGFYKFGSLVALLTMASPEGVKFMPNVCRQWGLLGQLSRKQHVML